MSDSEEGIVYPEWGIKLRKLIDRMVPIVNDHHHELDIHRQEIRKLEQKVAQQAAELQSQRSTIGQMQAQIVNLQQGR